MKRCLKIVSALVSVLLITAVAWGGLFGPGKKSSEYAETLLNLLHVPELLSQSVNEMINSLAAQDPNFFVDSGGYREFAAKYITWEKLKPKYIKMYTDCFTENELRVLVEFYKTPTGKKYIEKSGDLMLKSSQIVSEAFSERADELDEMVSKERIRIANELIGTDESGN